VACGFGGSTAILVSASLDHSCKIWSLGTGALLRSITLPRGITSVALDSGEQLLYAGGVEGSIWEIPLVDPSVLGRNAAQGLQLPIGVGMGEVTAVMQGHTKGVNCLVISADGEWLVSGGEDGCARVWEVRSRQCLRVLSAPGKGPVTGVLVTTLPAYLAGQGGPVAALAAGTGRRGPRRQQPLAQLAKFTGKEQGPG
jgi:pre-rRNA-processing protein IPI3